MPGHKRDPRTWRELWQFLSPAGRARLIVPALIVAALALLLLVALALLIALATASILAAL
jgi:hypothetical protein